MYKINLAVIFWWKSVEHKVSLVSWKNIIDAIDRDKYNIFPIWINTDWKWYCMRDINNFLLHPNKTNIAELDIKNWEEVFLDYTNGNIISKVNNSLIIKIDVVFPITHGNYWEDGSLQWLLKIANIPFVWPSVAWSANSMDKDIMKKILKYHNIPTTPSITIYKYQNDDITFEEIKKELWLPLFIKPSNWWSSIWISKVNNEKDFISNLTDAFQYDNKVIIEKYIEWREIECAVLWLENFKASIPWEIVYNKWFYDYDSKYITDEIILDTPAKLDKETISRVQDLAIKTFQAMDCEIMARVDMFLTKNWELFINELNTLPWFTPISMYPKLFAISWIKYSKLIDKLISLAIDRKTRDSRLKLL